MYKFAHMSDIHLGAHRDQILQELELTTFIKAMNKCVEHKVDFIIISGDLFHIGIPELSIVNKALRKMVEVKEKGIPIYVIYGSHDYTPTGTSIIDLLETAGIITNIVKWQMKDKKLHLSFTTDKITGAKITGILARKNGLESKYYERLDKQNLEQTGGFKIFMFHSGITEFKPTYLTEMDSIPISCFPKGFNYYAGGHIHEKGKFKLPGYKNVIFPGTLFTGYGRDIEATIKGETRGFYLVSFDDAVKKIEFIELKSFDGKYFEFDANGKNSVQAFKDIQEKLKTLDVTDKVVILKIRGELSGGKTADINFTELKSNLLEKGALHVYLNRYSLTSKDYSSIQVIGNDTSTIERKMFNENIGTVKLSQKHLKGEAGSKLATELLEVLRQEVKVGESKREYLNKIQSNGRLVLKLNEIFEEEIN